MSDHDDPAIVQTLAEVFRADDERLARAQPRCIDCKGHPTAPHPSSAHEPTACPVPPRIYRWPTSTHHRYARLAVAYLDASRLRLTAGQREGILSGTASRPDDGDGVDG